MGKWVAFSYDLTYGAYDEDDFKKSRWCFSTYKRAKRFARLCNQLGGPLEAKAEMDRYRRDTRLTWFERLNQRISDWYWCYNRKETK